MLPPLPPVHVAVRSAVARAGLGALLTALGFGGLDDPSAEVWIVDDAGLAEAAQLEEPPAVVVIGGTSWFSALPDAWPEGWAVLSADATPAELRAGVLGAAAGLVVLGPESLPLFSAPESEDQELTLTALEDVGLTPREREVLNLLAEGLSNKRAAKTLGVSESTVKFHVQAVYSKLGVQTRAGAVTRGIQLGLISI